MTKSELSINTTKKFVGIEALRWISAIGILFWHYQHFFYTKAVHADSFKDFERLPLYSILHPVYMNGAKGVQLFWAISGFVIIHNYGFKRIVINKFIKNRFARLYPLHIITLLVVSILQLLSMTFFREPQIYFENTFKNFLLHLFFASGWEDRPSLSFNQPVWSVSLEILVYGIFVLLMLFPKVHQNPAYFWTPMFVIIYVVSTIKETSGLFICLLFFALGAVLRCALNKIGGLVALASVCVLILSFFDAYLLGNRVFGSAFFQELNSYSLLIIQISSLIFLAVWFDTQEVIQRMSGKLRILGNLTYGTYLLHVPFQIFVLLILKMLNVSVTRLAENPGSLIAYLLILNFLAYWIYLRLELPLSAYVKRFGRKT